MGCYHLFSYNNIKTSLKILLNYTDSLFYSNTYLSNNNHLIINKFTFIKAG